MWCRRAEGISATKSAMRSVARISAVRMMGGARLVTLTARRLLALVVKTGLKRLMLGFCG